MHIPYHLTWAHERATALPVAPGRFHAVASIRALLPLLG
jgi:hypothetical protein